MFIFCERLVGGCFKIFFSSYTVPSWYIPGILFFWASFFLYLCLLPEEPSLLAIVILQILVCLWSWLASPRSCKFVHLKFKSVLEFLLCILSTFYVTISVTSLAYCLFLLHAKQKVPPHFKNSTVVGFDCWRDMTFKIFEHLIYEIKSIP